MAVKLQNKPAVAIRPKLPWGSILLMAIFIVGGSLMLLFEWPPGPAYLDWGVWIISYFGYLYLIAAAIYHVKTGN